MFGIMFLRNNRALVTFGIPLILLLIPLVAMQFSTEVNWGLMDFVVAGVLLFGLSFLLSSVSTRVKQKKYRILGFGISILLFILVWAELGVGIFGSRWAGS